MHPDDTRVAAFLEGRLHGEERERVMADLAAGVGDWAAFNDAAEILQQGDDGGLPGAARRSSSALRAIRGEPLHALSTATATTVEMAAAWFRRWMIPGGWRN